MKKLLILITLLCFSLFLSACSNTYPPETTVKSKSFYVQKKTVRKPIRRNIVRSTPYKKPSQKNATSPIKKHPINQPTLPQSIVDKPLKEIKKKKKKKKKKVRKITSSEHKQPIKVTTTREQEDAKESEENLTEIISD